MLPVEDVIQLDIDDGGDCFSCLSELTEAGEWEGSTCT